MLQQVFNTLINASIYALFAMGYALVFGVLDILNLAHGAIFMLGAFTAVQAVLGWHWPLVLAIPLGMVVGGAVGVVLDLVAVAPLQARGSGFLTPLISTIAAGIVFENISLGLFGPDAYSFPTSVFPQTPITIGGAVVQPVDLFVIGLTVCLMVGLTAMLRYSTLGKAIRAVAANRLAAQLLGINVARVVAITFFLASALGALAGIFYGLELQDSISFNMGGSVQLRGLAVIVVGGMDSIPGVMLGALALATSETIGITEIGSSYTDAIAFGLLFLILIVRPSGILGRRGSRVV
ncbi:MAG TPA: branched-chain amino acid ABC transporter permease [Chloroflexota bacterium]|nr:branched-chain amino acid ABC transporter permease [Chloroflexota bacterium]